MKSLRLLAAALLACTFAASAAFACDAHKSAKGTSASAAATTKTSAKGAASACTPEMAAACASNPAVATAMGCSPAGTTATAASTGKPAKSAAKAGDCCMMKSSKTSTTAVTAANTNTKTSTSAVTAANSKATSMDHCADAKSATATMAAAGMKCSAHTNAMVHDCSACEDWVACEQEVNALGARAQVVSLKNGAMIVYTVESPADVKHLQRVISQRHQKMVGAFQGTSGKVLCDECKSLRGAMASGKLHREVVNVERGCMTLITSNDRDVVTKIRSMTGQPVAMR